MECKSILFEVEDNVAVITFNRPRVLNAINSDTMMEFNRTIHNCREDENIKAAILTRAGNKAFVAGADVTEFKDRSPREIMRFLELGQGTLRLKETQGKPVITAVHGLALDGGAEISIACDIRFASDKARFSQPETLLGFIPGWGGTQRLARLIGIGRAEELIMSEEQIAAQRAYEIGLVNKVFPAEQLMGEARKFAQELAGMRSFNVKMIKYAINYGYDLP